MDHLMEIPRYVALGLKDAVMRKNIKDAVRYCQIVSPIETVCCRLCKWVDDQPVMGPGLILFELFRTCNHPDVPEGVERDYHFCGSDRMKRLPCCPLKGDEDWRYKWR